ncbi:hypothetical protein BBJ29_008638 [Phytophthora kernoviae]|uniref:DUF4038 domain-containing protein n=1 Tax=Phytophthora kernoviae TaxID=325452 RepID=A0A3F2RDG3_9STRA|nr:hypothetical protein BBJ29_008638 [Phytophthora kernoviae]RLN53929.1 hypothetical protein BBP00_00009125 [Phytophthora kernoviae]
MKVSAAIASLLSLAGLASTSLADPSWHDLVITAPQYGRYLYRTASEEPFFWKADTAWELTHRLNKTSIDFYLRTRAEQGYNVVQTVIISELNGTTRANFYGDLPYNNSDTTQPNEAYFELIDWTVDLAASYGILVTLVPVWGRPIENTTDIWVSMRTGVKEAETTQGYEPVILFHPTAGNIARPELTPKPYAHLMFPTEETRVSINAVQSGHAKPKPSSAFFSVYDQWDSTKNYEQIAGMRDAFTGPVLDLENHYEGAHVGFDSSLPIWNASEVRNGLYHGVYGGASGFTYGANSVWQMYEPTTDLLRESDYYSPVANQNATGSWREDIHFEGASQAQYVTKPLQNLTTATLEQLEPAREILASPSGYTSTSVNTYAGTRYISVLASQSRDRYYVYTGHGDDFSLQLDNGSGVRSGAARWFSPRDGEYYGNSTVSVPESGNDTRVDFIPPSIGGVDDDWLLVLEF